MNVIKKIDSGVLNLTVNEMNAGYTHVDQLLGFASRMNAKRGFLFVSTILGKHIPVSPSVMRESYDRMASMVGANNTNTLVVGMAETATGMGGGLADSLGRMEESENVYFQHTTRHALKQSEWFRLDEDHSHAVSHIVYEPLPQVKNGIEECTRLVLADDEISTGKTLLRLAQGYMLKLNKIDTIDIVALVSWLDDDKTVWFMSELTAFCEQQGVKLPTVNFHHLMRGSFTFDKKPEFNVDLPVGTDKGLATEESTMLWGRCGMKMPVNLTDAEWQEFNQNKEQSLSIVGTGEHLFHPFLVAEAIENTGREVVFQSTTRSPVFEDGSVIKSIDIMPLQRDGQEPVQHYIYNLDQASYEVQVVSECEEAATWYAPLMALNTSDKQAA